MAIEVTSFFPDTFERMARSVELVKQRMRRAAAALESAAIPYVVVGGNAVAAWAAQVDGDIRNTVDVDVAIRRVDFDRTREAMERAGFTYEHVWGVDCFLDGPDAKPSRSVHLLFADEKVRPTDVATFPSVENPLRYEGINFLNLRALVTAKLTSYRRKDQTHVDDLIRFGLVDRSWLATLPPELAERLQRLLDTPE